MQQRGSFIKSKIRRRIILHSGDEGLVLYEGKLAEEFGVSRTPIRQVIQALAAESLVEVRSGVGTIAPALVPERRDQDHKAYSAILGACAACAQQSSIRMITVELATLRMHLEADSHASPNDLFFDASTRFIAALSELVDDRILRSTLISCFWRFVRRRVDEHQGDISSVIQEMIKTLKDAEYGAERGDPEHILRMVSTHVDVMLNAPAG